MPNSLVRLALPLAVTASVGALILGPTTPGAPVLSSEHVVAPSTLSAPSARATTGAGHSATKPAVTGATAGPAGTSGASGPSAKPASSNHTYSGSPQSVTIFAFSGHSNPTTVVASLPAVVGGVSWIFGWSQIETAPGVYNWSAVDAAIAASSGSGRKTMLRIDGGATSPAWVPDQLTFRFKPMGPQPEQTVTMPKTWSTTYLADFTAFIRAYGARYNGDPRVTRVEMAGGGYQGEMALPQWSGWIGAGYTDTLMTSAWERLISTYKAAFPSKQLGMDYGEPLQTYYHSHIDPAVLAYARVVSNVDFQQNGLKSTTSQNWSTFKTLQTLSLTTRIGWQLWGGGNSSSYLMSAFRVAIASHASYVEVYLKDCTNPANASALAYLVSNGHELRIASVAHDLKQEPAVLTPREPPALRVWRPTGR